MFIWALTSQKEGYFAVLGARSPHSSQSRLWLLFGAIVWHPDSSHVILQCEEST